MVGLREMSSTSSSSYFYLYIFLSLRSCRELVGSLIGLVCIRLYFMYIVLCLARLSIDTFPLC